jgi:hypothetical protein
MNYSGFLSVSILLLSTAVYAQSLPAQPVIPDSATVTAAEKLQTQTLRQPTPEAAPALVEAYQYTPYKIENAVRNAAHVVLATNTANTVEKDEKGRLWTISSFTVTQAIKGGFENNIFSLRTIGGYREEPLLKEYLITGGLDLSYKTGSRYVMLLTDSGMDNRPIAARQQVYMVEEGSVPLVRDLKGGTIKILNPETKKPFDVGSAIPLDIFLGALTKVAK